ncbi:MAG: MFS transporter, partial [Pseudomonadales bacterium]|nr:MFS transporter [Pseudomonadales bacterium]
HIRTFSTLTTINGAALLCILLSDDPYVWSGLRLMTGIGISGCYLVIESWLNEYTNNAKRGRILAVYTVIVLLSMSVGQLLINLGSPSGFTTIVLGTLLLSLSIIPVALSKVEQPAPLATLEFRFKDIYHASPAAVGGALAIGTVTGALFGLTPVFGKIAGLSVSEIAWLMIVMVLGGAAFQLPAGHISDRYDRRKVMMGLLIIGIITAIVGTLLQQPPSWLVMLLFFIIGGSAIAIYPLCLAHANDRYPGQFLQVGTVILMVNGAGSITGPLLGANAMAQIGPSGFLAYLAAGLTLCFIWILIWLIKHREPPENTNLFVGTAKSTQALIELDPRTETGESLHGRQMD